jgi:hypothetical protein
MAGKMAMTELAAAPVKKPAEKDGGKVLTERNRHL